jgi:LPS O-antigen subunit length determinant protein (WzzB/FepE family)
MNEMATSPRAAVSEDQLDLAGITYALWRGKWKIAATAFLFTALAVAYALTATQWWSAEVWMAPSEEQNTRNLSNQIAGSLGGLVGNLAGISVGGGSNAEPLAVLQSRGFIREFIEQNELLDEIAAVGKLGDEAGNVDIRSAVDFFRDRALDVEENRTTRIVVMHVEWTDPDTAAAWANALVRQLNERMRERALQQADSSVNYLKRELEHSNVLTLQQSVGRLLEQQLQKAMLARVNDEFAFRVLDSAQPPNYRSAPRRRQIVMFAFIFGAFLSSFAVALQWALRDKRLETVQK